jgi:hypothetical protein
MLALTDQTAVCSRRHEKKSFIWENKPRRFRLCLFCRCLSLKHTRYATTPLPCCSLGLPPGYKLLPQEVVFLCCISQRARLFPKAVLPTYLPNLTYLPATLFTINYITCLSIFSHPYIHFCTQSFLLQLINRFFQNSLFNIFSVFYVLRVLFYFSSFPHFPIHSVYCFHFSSHFPCGLFNPIVWTLATLYLFAFLA